MKESPWASFNRYEGITVGIFQSLKVKRSRLERLGHAFASMEALVREEMAARGAGSPIPRWSLWRRGFTTESAALYGLRDVGDCARYVSDFEERVRLFRLNGDFGWFLNDKLAFGLLLKEFSDRVAPTVGVTGHGSFFPFGHGADGPVMPVMPLAEGLARLPGRHMLKPLRWSGGEGIVLHEYRDGRHHLDRRPVEPSELAAALGRRVRAVCPFVEQAAYARRIFPDVTNTLRILTMYDDERGEAFIAGATHRFAQRASGAVVDNFAQGGLSCGIDTATGTLDRATARSPGGGAAWHDVHPDTGARITGVTVDNWPTVRGEIAALARRLPFMPYVGWDVAVTDDGFRIIEGNNSPFLKGHQMYRPLLADERVRRFYERHGVLRPRGAPRVESLTEAEGHRPS